MMDNYTIRCSDEQTRKARKLGASLEYTYGNCGLKHYINPTAEQMIGWLETQGITSIEITFSEETKWKFEIFGEIYDYDAPYFSRQEATIAAIDAALDYLIDNNLIKK